MADSSFFKNNGTSSQIQGSANASAAAALASEQAALVSKNAAATSETNSAASAAAALVSKNAAATSAASANSDASAASISATASQTAATSSSANAALTSADATQTAADRVQTGLDRVATNSDAVQTAADRVQTGLDVTSSSASAAAALSSRNAAATSETNAAASAASSSADATATASDRVQTGLDAASTAADAIATAADRVQTGLDATASANSASAASTSATAAAASQVSAASSAASAAAVFNDFEDRYYGPHASDSAAQTHVTGLGLTVDQGDLYFNSTANEMRVYDGGSWIAASSAGGASLINYNYTATASQTAFTGSDDNSNTLSYTVDNLIVTRNGVVLEDGTDYTATDGSTITLTVAAAAGDEINVVAFKSFTTADMVSATNGGTFQSNVTVNGTMTATAFSGDGSALTGIPTPTLTSLGIANHDQVTVDGSGNLNVTGTISSNKGSAGTLATFTDGVNSNFVVETSSLLTTIGNGGGSAALALKANNTEAVRISATGSVGIGGSPNAILDVQAGAGADVAKIRSGSTNGTYFWQFGRNNSNGFFELGQAQGGAVTNNLVVDTAGRVSIGSSSPEALLHVEGASTGQMMFRTSGSSVNKWLIGKNSSADFSIGEDGNEWLYVQRDSGNVGIGTSSPSSFYSLADNLVVGTGSGGNGMTIYSGSADSGYIGFNDTASASMQGFIQYNHNGDYMAFAPNGTEKMRIDNSGRVTMPYQPAFWAYSPNTYTYTTTGALEFNSSNVGLAEQYDVGNNYNPSTGRFTAPVAGTYQITLTAAASYNSNYLYMYIMKNGTAFIARNFPQSSDYQNMPLNAVITLAAGDYISCKTEKNATGGALYAPSFTGFLIG